MTDNTYSCLTTASFHKEKWYQAEPLIETWKSLLQALPGYIACEIWVRPLDGGDVRCVIQVTWEYREQLEEFLECQWATEKVIATLDPPPYDVRAENRVQHL